MSAVNVLVIVNDPAYGSERAYNALRLAGQKVPDGYYHLDRMLSVVIHHGGEVACCGTCLDARALMAAMLVDGARRSTLEELTDWTLAADQTLVF